MSEQEEYVINGSDEQSNINNNETPLGSEGEPPKDPYLGLKIFIIIVVSIAVVTAIYCAFLGFAGVFDEEPTPAPVVAIATLKPTATPKPTSTPKPTEIPTPVFTEAYASSTRGTDSEGGEYSAYAVLDGKALTKWAPTQSSLKGVGEMIGIRADTEQLVNGVYIENGYPKDLTTWKKNCRVKNIIIEFSDGTRIEKTLEDTKAAQKVDFGRTVKTNYIEIIIMSVYEGTTWDDVAIAEITAY